MGDMADDMMYEALKQEAEYDALYKHELEEAKNMEFRYLAGILKWRKKSGESIYVSKMTDEHVKNALNMMQRQDIDSPLIDMWIKLLTIELEKRSV